MKRRKSSKEAESSRDYRSKEKKSSSTSKDASHSQHMPSGKSAHTEEPSHTVDDSRVQQNQEFDTRYNTKQPADKEVSKAEWFNQVARAKEPTTSFDELINTPIDFSAFILNRLNIKDLTQAILVGPAFDLLKGTCKSLTELEYHLEECSKATTERLEWHNPKGKLYPFDLNKPLPLIPDHRVTRLTIMKKYDYGYLEEIEVRREDQQLYKFREGDLPRLHLQDIEDMSNLRNKTAYTAYSNPKGVIYEDQNNRNRLMRADELYKFSDGTLNDVRNALHDIASGIRMEIGHVVD
ncbi:hypothetical protein Tco_0524603 [Tanacetum coccineum]